MVNNGAEKVVETGTTDIVVPEVDYPEFAGAEVVSEDLGLRAERDNDAEVVVVRAGAIGEAVKKAGTRQEILKAINTNPDYMVAAGQIGLQIKQGENGQYYANMVRNKKGQGQNTQWGYGFATNSELEAALMQQLPDLVRKRADNTLDDAFLGQFRNERFGDSEVEVLRKQLIKAREEVSASEYLKMAQGAYDSVAVLEGRPTLTEMSEVDAKAKEEQRNAARRQREQDEAAQAREEFRNDGRTPEKVGLRIIEGGRGDIVNGEKNGNVPVGGGEANGGGDKEVQGLMESASKFMGQAERLEKEGDYDGALVAQGSAESLLRQAVERRLTLRKKGKLQEGWNRINNIMRDIEGAA